MIDRSDLSAAISFWEPLRGFFNLALAVIGAVSLSLFNPENWKLVFEMAPILVILAALANLLYCAAYPVDLLVRRAGLVAPWRVARWAVFAIGLTVALAMEAVVLVGAAGLGISA